MMKNKYNIQVSWYVQSDQSSRSFRVGHQVPSTSSRSAIMDLQLFRSSALLTNPL